MKEKDKSELIWSYLDNNITIEEKIRVDKMRMTDGAFASLFSEMEQVHTSLQHIPLEEASSEFSSSLEQSLLDKFGRRDSGISIVPLVMFGILLTSLGVAFSMLGTSGTISIDLLSGGSFSSSDMPLLDYMMNALNSVSINGHWYYYIIFLLMPTLYIFDKVGEKRFTMKNFVLV